ncbi:MAG: hypothetical protein I8H75_02930 [Myxococcaceae bacterium]|nr:hypothetical protein [Myxococcaceae bacterium]MBH2006284.1 hypothetical protein [Myxococcaceae bacterium]
MKSLQFLGLFIAALGLHSNSQYPSAILGIKAHDHPPYAVLEDVRAHPIAYKEFASILLELAIGNEPNDQVGVDYLAKIYRRYCPKPKSLIFDSLSPYNQMAIEDLLKFPQGVFQKAAESVGCRFLSQD